MIYANYNSTAPLRKSVFPATAPFLQEHFGNPSEGGQPLGRVAKDAIENARSLVATLVGAQSNEIVFTSGGSESCFLGLSGLLAGSRIRGIAISSIEHPAVREAAQWLSESLDFSVVEIPVNRASGIDRETFETLLKVKPGVLSVMLANNETGDILPVKALAREAKAAGWYIHCDATQAVGRIAVSLSELEVDLLSFSAHKIGGPKGVGALAIKEDTPFHSPLKAGGQEQGRRGGTEAVPAIVGFGAAAEELLGSNLYEEEKRLGILRDKFESKILSAIPGASVHRHAAFPRLANTSNIYLPQIISFRLVERLADRGVIIAAGSACANDQLQPSKTLQALGYSTNHALGSVRISFGNNTTEEEVTAVTQNVIETWHVLQRETEQAFKRQVHG